MKCITYMTLNNSHTLHTYDSTTYTTTSSD